MLHFFIYLPTRIENIDDINGAPKGQLISEQIYAVLNFPNMQQNIVRISALASKLGQIKKSKDILSS